MDSLSLLIAIFFSLATPSTAYAQQPMAPAVLVAIGYAESGGRQYDASGRLLCDGVTHSHCGIYQIGLSHAKQALSMGWDIRTPEGNTAEAIWLYQQQGTGPWEASYNDPSNPNSWGKSFYRDGTPRGSSAP